MVGLRRCWRRSMRSAGNRDAASSRRSLARSHRHAGIVSSPWLVHCLVFALFSGLVVGTAPAFAAVSPQPYVDTSYNSAFWTDVLDGWPSGFPGLASSAFQADVASGAMPALSSVGSLTLGAGGINKGWEIQRGIDNRYLGLASSGTLATTYLPTGSFITGLKWVPITVNPCHCYYTGSGGVQNALPFGTIWLLEGVQSACIDNGAYINFPTEMWYGHAGGGLSPPLSPQCLQLENVDKPLTGPIGSLFTGAGAHAAQITYDSAAGANDCGSSDFWYAVGLVTHYPTCSLIYLTDSEMAALLIHAPSVGLFEASPSTFSRRSQRRPKDPPPLRPRGTRSPHSDAPSRTSTTRRWTQRTGRRRRRTTGRVGCSGLSRRARRLTAKTMRYRGIAAVATRWPASLTRSTQRPAISMTTRLTRRSGPTGCRSGSLGAMTPRRLKQRRLAGGLASWGMAGPTTGTPRSVSAALSRMTPIGSLAAVRELRAPLGTVALLARRCSIHRPGWPSMRRGTCMSPTRRTTVCRRSLRPATPSGGSR